jgi:tetratricopeptide (TPR) repeat protein
MKTSLLILLFLMACLPGGGVAAQSMPGTPPSDETTALIKQAQQLNREGKQDAALEVYAKVLASAPDNVDAHLGMGIALDLKGDYAEARTHLQKAIDLSGPEMKARALRTMAMSYAFEQKAGEAAKYEQPVFDDLVARQDFTAAAGVANELARIYVESGDLDNGYAWYKKGYETALRKSGLSEADRNLWQFRWEHAQARIAVRRRQRAETEKHVAAARAALDKANNPDQAVFFPYLMGYVAFYRGDFKKAITDLQHANQDDPFIQCLLAQAYEKTGDKARAMEHYRRVLESNAHNPTAAFSRPLARKKLGAG